MAHDDDKQCPICGDKKDNPNTRTCYGCYLDGLLPKGYAHREHYGKVWYLWLGGEWREVRYDITAAPNRPATGVPILDETPTRISQVGERCIVQNSGAASGVSVGDFLAYGLACHRIGDNPISDNPL